MQLSLWPCRILILNIVAFAMAPNHELSFSLDRKLLIIYAKSPFKMIYLPPI